jgi:hypothetical protein
MITARNYAAQAEKGLMEYAQRAKKYGAKLDPGYAESAQRIEEIAHKIGKAVHFALPDNGRLLNDKLRGIDGALVRLPYPSITVEYFCKEISLTKELPVSMPKRLALASEIEVDGKMFFDIFVANFSAEYKEWVPQSIGFRMDLTEPIERAAEGVLVAGEPLVLNKGSLNKMISTFGIEKAIKNAYHDVDD